MVRIINNNWSPIPWGWGCDGHHNCGGNNWMSNMLKYNFMFQMMNNMQNMFKCYATAPQQQGGFYPGLDLGGGGSMPQNYEAYLKQQRYNQDFAELKSSYTGFRFTNIGGEYQARLTSNPSVRFSGSTPLELMEAMDEYIDEHPEDFKSKPAERKERVNESEESDEIDDKKDKVNDIVNDGKGDGTSNLAEGWGSTYFSEATQTNLGTKPTLDSIIDKICFNADNLVVSAQRMTAEQKEQLKNDIIKYNSTYFNSDGTCKCDIKWDKFNLPDGKTLRDTYGALPNLNNDWSKYPDASIRNMKAENATPSAQELIDMYQYTNCLATSTLTQENKDKLIDDIIKNNPHCFDEDGNAKDTFDWKTLWSPNKNGMISNYGLKEKNITATKDDDNSKGITIKNNDTVLASVVISGGKFSRDANLYIQNGKYKGKWKFKDGEDCNGDQINYSHFSISNNKITCNIKCTGIKNNETGATYKIEKQSDGTMLIIVDERKIPLEEFFLE